MLQSKAEKLGGKASAPADSQRGLRLARAPEPANRAALSTKENTFLL